MRVVRIETPEDGIRVLVLDRPPVNALGRELVDDLFTACDTLREDTQARCVVVRSAGKHFCAGADLKERQGMTLDEVRAFVPKLAGVCNALAGLPMPTIAAVRGTAAGGGCEVALGCDLRILAEDATIGLRETALAILPGAGGTQRLPRLVGKGRALQLILSGEMITAQEAYRIGLVNEVVSPADLIPRAEAILKRIFANAPLGVRYSLEAVNRGMETTQAEGLALEASYFGLCAGTEDKKEGTSAFLEKRPAKFQGR